MMKFFRKYTKELLAVFMALLLLVWLGGDALSSMMNDRATSDRDVRGEAFGEPVQIRHMKPAYDEAAILDMLVGRMWRHPWMFLLRDMGMNNQALYQTAMQIRSEPLSNDEWYMLDAEARKSHIHVPPEAVERFKKELRLTPEQINYIRTHEKRSLQDIDRALQSYIRVQESLVLASNALKTSEADIRDMVRQTMEKAKVAAILVTAKPFLDPNYQPTPEEFTAHFDKYKNVASKPADSPEYGYEIADAVKVEYIRVNMPPLIARQTATDEETYSYWKGHKNEFTKPSTQPASTQPATQPEQPQAYGTFTEARPKVLEKLLKDRAKVESLRIAREVIGLLQQPWVNAPTSQPGDLKTPPESQTQPDVYDKLVQQLEQKYPGVLRVGRTEWVDQNEINKVPDFNRAAAMPGTQQEVRIMEAAFLVPPFDSKLQENPARARFVRNLYETAPEPFVNPDGDAVIVRTVSVRPKHPPDPEAIRERLVTDIQRDRAYKEAERQANLIAERAAKDGLAQLWASDPTLKEKFGEEGLLHPQAFPRQQIYSFGGAPEMYPASVPGLGYDEDLSKAIFDLAGTTSTQPTKIIVREQQSNERFAVIQLLEILPVTREEYEKERPRSLQLVQSTQQIELLTNWFDPEQIKNRVGWKDANPRVEEESAEAKTEQQPS